MKEMVIEMDLERYFQKSELIPAIVVEEKNKEVLMLAYMNKESLQKTLETGYTWFYSRSRHQSDSRPKPGAFQPGNYHSGGFGVENLYPRPKGPRRRAGLYRQQHGGIPDRLGSVD